MLEVVYAPVAERLADAAGHGPIHQAAPGRAVLDLPSIARVLLEHGERAIVEPAAGASGDDVTWMLAGPVRHVGWLQRGTMALRASAVVVGDRAVALVGWAATGKSAVAATLASRGHRVLADSVLPITGDPVGLAHGTTDALELWPDAVIDLGLDPNAGAVVRPALAKRAHAFPAATSARVAAVVVLERAGHQGDPVITRLGGQASATAVGSHTAMAPLLEPLGLRAEHFRWATQLAADVPVFHLSADMHRRDLATVADRVESLVA